MKCPYRKKIHIYPDGLGRTTEVEFMKCDEDECPFFGIAEKIHKQYGGHQTFKKFGCRKAEKECQ